MEDQLPLLSSLIILEEIIVNEEEHFKKLETVYQMIWELKDDSDVKKELETVLSMIDDVENDLEIDEDRMEELTQKANDDLYPFPFK
jgi:hypothetical protein